MVTIITGGTRGIGRACALRLAASGRDLVLGYATDDASAQETLEEVQELGVRAVTVRSDIRTDEGIEALFAAASEYGPLTGLVNNAGATLHIAPLADTPADVVRTSIDLNLTSPLLIARRAVQEMSTARGGAGGVICTVSSGAATIGSPNEYIHYAASKAGLDIMTKALAIEVGAVGIRVVGVAPGHIYTRVHADAGDPGRVDRLASTIPMQRGGQPDEVAATVAWLMSDEASYITGDTLRVSGGR